MPKSKDDIIQSLCKKVERMQKSEQQARQKLEKALQKLKTQSEQLEKKIFKEVSAVHKKVSKEIEFHLFTGVERNAKLIAKLAERVQKKSAEHLNRKKPATKAKSKSNKKTKS